jgi:hypothetical protein
MRAKIILLAAVLLVLPASAQIISTKEPASDVVFTDTEDLQAKFDAGDLGGVATTTIAGLGTCDNIDVAWGTIKAITNAPNSESCSGTPATASATCQCDEATAAWRSISDGTGSGSLGANLSSTGNAILSDTGSILLGGTGNTNNNKLTFDFETGATTVDVTTSTGVTTIDLSDFTISGLAIGTDVAPEFADLTALNALLAGDELKTDYRLFDATGDFEAPVSGNFDAAIINLITHNDVVGAPPDHADMFVEYWYLMPGSTINQSSDASGKNNTTFKWGKVYDMAESQMNAFQQELHCATSGDCILVNDNLWGGGSANATGDEAAKLWRGQSHDGPEFLPTGTIDTANVVKADTTGTVTLGNARQLQRVGENNYLVYTDATPVNVTVTSVAAPVWTATGADLSTIEPGDSSGLSVGQFCFSLDNATYQGTGAGDSKEWLPVILADDGTDTFTTGYYRNGVNQGWPLQYPDDGVYTAAGTFLPCDKISDFTFDTPPTTASVNNPGATGMTITFADRESSDPGCSDTACATIASTGLDGADWASTVSDNFDIVPGGPPKGLATFDVTHQRLRGNSDSDSHVGIFRLRGNRSVRQFFKFGIQANDTRGNPTNDDAVDYMARAGHRFDGDDLVDRVIEVDGITESGALPSALFHVNMFDDTTPQTEDVCLLDIDDEAGCQLWYDGPNTQMEGAGLGGGGGTIDTIQGDGDVTTSGAAVSIDGGTGISTAVVGDVLTVTGHVATTASDVDAAGSNATPLTWNVTPATCTGDGNGGTLTVNGSDEIICAGDDGGGGGTAWSAITTSTNTGQTLTVGTGSSLVVADTGVIAATTTTGVACTNCVDASDVAADVATQAEIDLKAPLDSPIFTTVVELPQSATPTTDATGEIALDTTITDHQPLWQYEAATTQDMTIIALDTAELPAVDGEIIQYDAATDKFVLASPLWTDAGAITHLTSVTDDFAIGGTTSAAALFFDEATGALSINVAGGSVDVQAHATNGASLQLKEGADDGSNTATISVPDAGITSDFEWVLPDDAAPADTEILGIASVAAGVITLEWQADGGSAPGTDSVGTVELDDGASTPFVGEWVQVASGALEFDYRTDAEARTDLGLVIGTDVAPEFADLAALNALIPETLVDAAITASSADTLTNKTLDGGGTGNSLELRSSADCDALTDGVTDEPCWDTTSETIWVCEPSAGGCDTAGEWKDSGAGGGNTAWDDIVNPDATKTITWADGDVNTMATSQSSDAVDGKWMSFDYTFADDDLTGDAMQAVRIEATVNTNDGSDALEMLVLSHLDSAGTAPTTGIRIQSNEATAGLMANAIRIAGVTGAIETGIDVSTDVINTEAIALGENAITVSGVTVDAAELEELATIEGNTIEAGDWTALAAFSSSILPVANGGTALASGTSGGILGYTDTGTLASTAAIANGDLIVGGGAGAVPTAVPGVATGSVLMSGGVAADPVWTAQPAIDCTNCTAIPAAADLNDITNVTLTTPADGASLCFTGTSNASVDCTVGGDLTATEDAGTQTFVVVDDSHNHIITNIDSFTAAELQTQTSDVTTFYTEDTVVPIADGGTGHGAHVYWGHFG